MCVIFFSCHIFLRPVMFASQVCVLLCLFALWNALLLTWLLLRLVASSVSQYEDSLLCRFVSEGYVCDWIRISSVSLDPLCNNKYLGLQPLKVDVSCIIDFGIHFVAKSSSHVSIKFLKLIVHRLFTKFPAFVGLEIRVPLAYLEQHVCSPHQRILYP